MEGLTNLTFSVILARHFGAIGVAAGTLIGAFVGLAGHLFYNMRRTTEIRISVSDYLVSSLLRPTLCVLPVACAAAIWGFLPTEHFAARLAWGGAATAATAGMLWSLALLPEERANLISTIRAKFQARAAHP